MRNYKIFISFQQLFTIRTALFDFLDQGGHRLVPKTVLLLGIQLLQPFLHPIDHPPSEKITIVGRIVAHQTFQLPHDRTATRRGGVQNPSDYSGGLGMNLADGGRKAHGIEFS